MENKFTDICTFEVLYKAYLAARRGKRSRAATAHYEVHLLENIVNLVYILTTKTYRPGVFRVFYWAELVRPVRQKAFSWRRNDGNRAAALREAKRAQELAKMSQMAQQIAEAMVKHS